MPKWKFADIPDQTGRIVICTGANSGLGFEFTRHMVARHAHVIMACRSELRGKAALAEIMWEFPQGSAEMQLLDVSDKQSIHAFADYVLRTYNRLDILHNNAGIMMRGNVYIDGVESTFATNTFGPFLLSGLLLPLLEKTPGSRIVWVGSLLHKFATKTNWQKLNDPKRKSAYWRHERYNVSKALNILFAKRLANELRANGSQVQCVVCHPGIARTGAQGKADNIFLRAFYKYFVNWIVGQSSEKGAVPMLMAATEPQVMPINYVGPGGMGEFSGYPWIPVQDSAIKGVAQNTAFGVYVWRKAEEWSGFKYHRSRVENSNDRAYIYQEHLESE